MAEKELIRMSKREAGRVGIIQQILEKKLKQVSAAKILEISDRQMRRLVRVVRIEGIVGVVHKSRGRKGNRRISDRIRVKILKTFYKKYPDFGPMLASEKLSDIDKLKVDHDTLRRWLIEDGEKHEWQRRKRPHRKWRERKDSFGEMVQMDGSHHDWLEGRGPKLVLMGYVDDATGEKFGKFFLYEGTVPAMDSFKGYAEKYGLPLSVYLDKHSTYKITRKATIFEELQDKEALTQFERAMGELGVKVIHAHSAPAKGRVENMFKTFQDRLVKEMRLAGIKTLEDANKFLEGFLIKYNKRFRVPAKNSADLHREKPPKHDLAAILCKKYKLSLRKDSTVHYDKRGFLIITNITRRAKEVDLEERLDGSIWISHKGRYLKHKEVALSVRINKEEIVYKEVMKRAKKKRKSSVPAKNHPWRKVSPDHYIDSCDYGYLETDENLVNA